MGSLCFASRATVVAAFLVTFATSARVDAALLNVVNWNMGNLPNTVDDESQLSTIFGHIGTVGGRPLDLLAMQETDTASAVRTAEIARSAFGVDAYTSISSTSDGGNDRTGFVYNTNTLSPLATVELGSPGTITHRILRTHFQPVGGAAGTDFYVYSTHLKSGAASSDSAARASEAQQLRANADALGAANVMFIGDFNWAGASERSTPGTSAYEIFSSSGEGRVTDAASAVGEWRDNGEFLSLHSNDPGAAMDDRFDMQLISDELRDGVGFDYLTGTYRVIGNNGTHVLNADIRTGTGAPTDVLDALYNFGDHLPVFASYSFTVPEPGTLLVAIAGVSVASRRRRACGESAAS